jgi:O-antigen ligase
MKDKIFLIVLLIPFFKPDIVVHWPLVNQLFNGYLMISSLYISFMYIKHMKENGFSKFMGLTLLFNFIALLSTFLNEGLLVRAFQQFISNVCIVMAIEMGCYQNKKNLIDVLAFIFFSLTLINISSIFIYPEGLAKTAILKTPIYFLGIDNRFSFVYLPGICIMGLHDFIYYGKLKFLSYCYFLICFISLFVQWSVGALVAVSIYFFYYFFIYRKKVWAIFSPICLFCGNIGAYFSLTYLRIQNYFSFLIVDILHKDLTLSSRTGIWDRVNLSINEHLLLGCGLETEEIKLSKMSAYHSHNQFLNITYQYGFIGLFSYLLQVFYCFYALHQYKQEEIAKLLSSSLFIIFIMLLVDTFDITNNLMILMALAANVSILVEGDKNAKSRDCYVSSIK